jgi:hypothetical protein
MYFGSAAGGISKTEYFIQLIIFLSCGQKKLVSGSG